MADTLRRSQVSGLKRGRQGSDDMGLVRIFNCKRKPGRALDQSCDMFWLIF